MIHLLDKEFEIFQQTITKYKQYMSDVYKSIIQITKSN